jgi:hypothetical protein
MLPCVVGCGSGLGWAELAAGADALCSCCFRVAAALRAAARRFLVRAAFLPAALSRRVRAAFLPAALSFLVLAAFFAAARRSAIVILLVRSDIINQQCGERGGQDTGSADQGWAQPQHAEEALMGRHHSRRTIAASRTQLWLASGWGCRDRRLSRG